MATAHHPVKVGFLYSLIISIISLVLTAIFYATDMYTVLWTGYFVNAVLFLGVLFAIWHYNRQHEDKSSTKALFGIGLRITLVVTVVLTIFSIIMHLITQSGPSGSAIAAQGSEGVGPQGVDMPRNFWVFLISNVFFSNGVVGILATLMGAMYFKRNQKTTDED